MSKIIKLYYNVDVLTSAKNRIKSIFQTTKSKISFNISGGKDSIVLNDILFNMCRLGEIDKSKLQVDFVDEEAMYDDVIDGLKKMRLQWLSIGVPFSWYCVQNRHYDCLRQLADEESFICWDKKIDSKNWCRSKPSFAKEDESGTLLEREENYQSWLHKKVKKENIVVLTGVRCSESYARLKTMSVKKKMYSGDGRLIWPIYDWTNDDIWLYIKKHSLDFPETYIKMYQIGVSKKDLRISQFFALDTVQALSRIVYIYPDLYERILRREPNAYLLLLYSGTDMFAQKQSGVYSDSKIKQLDNKYVDYKKEVLDILYNGNPKKLRTVSENSTEWKAIKRISVVAVSLSEQGWKIAYNILLTGDHKQRKTRMLLNYQERSEKQYGR